MIPLVVTGATSLASKLIHTSAAGPNAAAAATLLPDAIAGNLAAVQCFRSRAYIQTQSSAAPWAAGVQQFDPGLIDAATKAVAAGLIPESWWQDPPEQVVAHVRQYGGIVAPQTPGVVQSQPGQPTGLSKAGAVLAQLFGPTATQAGAAAGNAAAAQAGTQAKTFLLLTVLVAAGVIGFLVLKRRG